MTSDRAENIGATWIRRLRGIGGLQFRYVDQAGWREANVEAVVDEVERVFRERNRVKMRRARHLIRALELGQNVWNSKRTQQWRRAPA